MTRQQKVNFLSQYKKINKQYKIVFESYKTHRMRLTSISAQIITDMPTTHSASDRMCDALIILEDLQQKADAMLLRLRLRKAQIIRMINSVEIDKSRSILTYRYVNCYSWRTIRNKMGVSPAHLFRLHLQGLDLINV